MLLADRSYLWEKLGGQVIWEKAAAYSDIVLVKDEIVGVLYENGDNGSYERISFERVPLGYAFIK